MRFFAVLFTAALLLFGPSVASSNDVDLEARGGGCCES